MLRATLFQCMVSVRDPFDLRVLCRSLRANGLDVSARSPGSLGQVVPDLDQWQIGSLFVKLHGLSVTVFSQKVKISGGSRGFYTSGETSYDAWLEQHVVTKTMTVLEAECAEWKLCLLNGSVKIPDVDPMNYMRVCTLLCSSSSMHVVPPTMFTAPSKRGRVCSVCVKCTSGGSIRFDHSGKAQMFAFRSLEDMHRCVYNVIEIIRTFT